MINTILFGGMIALIVSLFPSLRNIASGIGIRGMGIAPGDIVEHGNDIAWLRKVGLLFTILEVRTGESILIPNYTFAGSIIGPNQYSRSRVSQQLPLTLFAEPDVQGTVHTEPPRDCRRLPLLRVRSHHDETERQYLFT